MIDEHVLDKIIRAAEITKDDYVLELGHGIGTMTQYLACAAREVTAVEIDRALIPILEDTLKEYDNVSIINEDILKVDIAALEQAKNGGRPVSYTHLELQNALPDRKEIRMNSRQQGRIRKIFFRCLRIK